MTAYARLMDYQKDTEALMQVRWRLEWDREAVMPAGSSEQRASEIAALSSVIHERRTSAIVGDLLEVATPTDAYEDANVRRIRRQYERNIRVPNALATRISLLSARAQQIWLDSKRREDAAELLPMLEEMVNLRREEAGAIRSDCNPYDTLLQDYEDGLTSVKLERLFARLRPISIELRNAFRDDQKSRPLEGHFPADLQLKVIRDLASVFHFDFNRGRIDRGIRAGIAGSGNDVRILARIDTRNPLGSIYSFIHELGHASYEQGIAHTHLLTPLGFGASYGVHESQSRLLENQIGRSRPFSIWLFRLMQNRFGDIGVSHWQEFHELINQLSDGYLRIESDELQYNLHIILRFDLERALICGDLRVKDLEAAWNARFLSDFGKAIDRPSNGFLQDIHWPAGSFGYFPTYSLGNIYAACLFETMQEQICNLSAHIERADLSNAVGWLRKNVHQFGGLRSGINTIKFATGKAPNEDPLIRHLQKKFTSTRTNISQI